MEPNNIKFEGIQWKHSPGASPVVLNLIPLPPLDGSNIISLFLHDNAARKYRQIIRNPVFGFIGLFLAWQLFSPLFHYIFVRAINLIYWGSHFA